jgi:hypothetical protein
MAAQACNEWLCRNCRFAVVQASPLKAGFFWVVIARAAQLQENNHVVIQISFNE